jgi:hypothetical protein
MDNMPFSQPAQVLPYGTHSPDGDVSYCSEAVACIHSIGLDCRNWQGDNANLTVNWG